MYLFIDLELTVPVWNKLIPILNIITLGPKFRLKWFQLGDVMLYPSTTLVITVCTWWATTFLKAGPFKCFSFGTKDLEVFMENMLTPLHHQQPEPRIPSAVSGLTGPSNFLEYCKGWLYALCLKSQALICYILSPFYYLELVFTLCTNL